MYGPKNIKFCDAGRKKVYEKAHSVQDWHFESLRAELWLSADLTF